MVEAWQGRSESVVDDIFHQNIKTSPRSRSMQVVVKSRPSEMPVLVKYVKLYLGRLAVVTEITRQTATLTK